MSALDHTATAVLERSPAPGGWTYVGTDWSAAFFGTRGLVSASASSADRRSRRGGHGDAR